MSQELVIWLNAGELDMHLQRKINRLFFFEKEDGNIWIFGPPLGALLTSQVNMAFNFESARI